MNIAIVDDEKIELETAEVFLRYYIKTFYPNYESNIHIELFQRQNEFLTYFNPKIYQVVILGGNMRKLANYIANYNVKIIFIKPQEDFIMNIAIVDDEISELNTAEYYLRNFIEKNYPEIYSEIKIHTFSNANDFLNAFKPGFFQLVILDIRMEEINGIQIAQIIRARGDDDANIVFLTSSEDFILNGYRVFAVGYFLKPISNHEDDFTRTFEHIFPKIFKNTQEIILTVDGNKIFVPNRNILYLDIDYRHRLCVYLADGKKFVTTNNYSEIQPLLLTDERFLECYHRIIVNMDYIKNMEPDDFILMDGTSIPISQRKKKDVKIKFMRYFAHK